MFKRTVNMKALMLLVMLAGNWLPAAAVEIRQGDEIIIPDRVMEPVTLDGRLEEPVWQTPPINRPFKTVYPTFGQPFGPETRIWAAYDRESLYFAFRCFDTDPAKIKTSIAQRDKILRDDYVGVLLDALGSRQSSYEFYVNPSGIQMDGINSAVSGVDIAPDFVWESAAALTGDGYQVEVRIPLESIRYQSDRSGDNEVRMGVVFFRSVPHLGIMGTWPEIPAGQTDFNVMAALLYRGLKGGLRLEVLPNFTTSWNSEQLTPQQRQTTGDTNIGVSLKYGITSSITAEATVNPDFSQVESDAFQVEVNRRYPVFYSEKRPFFMESKEVLDFTIVNNGMMILPIDTRRIADPGWAVKFSGSSGRLNFVLLGSNDRTTGREWTQGDNPYEGKSALFGIFRAKTNIGGDNSLGVLYSGRHLPGQHNDVWGVDLKYRLTGPLRASLSYLGSASRKAEGEAPVTGSGLNAMLEYTTPRLISWAIYERYDSDFFMATAFQNRLGISRGGVGIGPVFNLNLKGLPWLKRFVPAFNLFRLYDLESRLTDTSWKFSLNFGFAPRGDLSLAYWNEDEAWVGQMFNKKYFQADGSLQLFKWLYLAETVSIGERLYYHPETPFVGRGRTIGLSMLLEPGSRLKLGFDYWHEDLKEKQGQQKVYVVDIYNLETAYQFNRYFFLRGIVRYNSYQGKWLTDLLASFTLIPGTVVHLGYGSLHLRNRWQDNRWLPGQGDLLKMKEGLFFKASYLWRFK